MATWPAHLGHIPPHGPECPVGWPSLFVMEADVLFKWGKTVHVFIEFVACGSKSAAMLNTCVKPFFEGGGFSLKLEAQNVTALFFMYVM